MKKINLLITLLIFLLITEITSAQNYTFRVLANKGVNKVEKSSGEVSALKTGGTLSTTDALIAGQGAYIGLMHKSGKTIEVRKSGTFAISELEKKVNITGSSTSSRYTSFINEKMNEQASGSYRSRMAATGSATRGTSGTISTLMVLEDGTVKVRGDKAVVRWIAPDNLSHLYHVKVMNIESDVIFETKTEDTFHKLDFTSEEMKNDLGLGLYIFNVSDSENESLSSGNIGIKRILDEDELTDEFETLRSEISDDTSMGKLIHASFYEEKGMWLDALTKYEEAIQMEPDVQDFKEIYQNFLLVNGIIEKK